MSEPPLDDFKKVLKDFQEIIAAGTEIINCWKTGALPPYGEVYLDRLMDSQGWHYWEFVENDPDGSEYFGSRQQYYSQANYQRTKRSGWRVSKIKKVGKVYHLDTINPYKIKFNKEQKYDNIVRDFLEDVALANGEWVPISSWTDEHHPKWASTDPRRDNLLSRIRENLTEDIHHNFEEKTVNGHPIRHFRLCQEEPLSAGMVQVKPEITSEEKEVQAVKNAIGGFLVGVENGRQDNLNTYLENKKNKFGIDTQGSLYQKVLEGIEQRIKVKGLEIDHESGSPIFKRKEGKK